MERLPHRQAVEGEGSPTGGPPFFSFVCRQVPALEVSQTISCKIAECT